MSRLNAEDLFALRIFTATDDDDARRLRDRAARVRDGGAE